MISLAFTLFIAGVLTILLPCILPLIPIVLGVSIADRNRWRPLVTISGMHVSFVGFTFPGERVHQDSVIVHVYDAGRNLFRKLAFANSLDRHARMGMVVVGGSVSMPL